MTAKRARADDDVGGFTLLELLIALTLLSLLTVALSGGMRFGARAWERSTSSADAMEQVRIAQAVLRDQLRRAYPYYDTSDPLQPHIAFSGEPNKMTFVAPAPRSLAPAGRMNVLLESVSPDGNLQLAISERHELAAENEQRASETDVLLRNYSALAFAYFGSEQASQPAEWHDAWVNERSLPQLIRVHIEFPHGDPRRWPDLVMAPVLTADVGCVFDPVTKYCQGR